MKSVAKTIYSLLATAVLAACVTAPEPAKFPTEPVKIVVPYPVGNATDVIARIVAERLAEVGGNRSVSRIEAAFQGWRAPPRPRRTDTAPQGCLRPEPCT